MNCSRCLSKFDEARHVPKLLVMCGHTLCEKCCQELFKNGKIQCIHCRTNTFVDRIASLPKNLALISEKNSFARHCLKHSKKYEGRFLCYSAFCSNQKSLICIQCILQDGHKNHEMNSVSKAYQLQSSNIQTKTFKIQSYLSSLEQKSAQNTKNQTESFKNFTTINETVKQSFQLIRQLINEQQKNLLKEVEMAFRASDEKFSDKNKLYCQMVKQLREVLDRVGCFRQLSQIDFLDRLKQQEAELSLIKFSSLDNQKVLTFHHNKSSILQSCIKTLTSQKNPPKTSLYSSNNSQMSNAPPKSQKTPFVQPIRGFRKAAFSNISNNCQNNKPQRKVSARKQSISHQVQPPIIKTVDKEKALKVSNNRIPISSENSSQKKTIKKVDIVDYVNSDLSSVDARESLCNSFMSNMTSFMSENRSICILGGFNDENNNIMKLDLMSNMYQEVSTLSANRSKFGAIFADRKLYVFGGKRGKQRLNDIEMFDFQRNTWTKVGTMSKSRSGFGIVIVQDDVYLIGGNDGQNILNTVEAFNIKTKEWKRLPLMNEARDELAVTVGNDDKIYAIGGFGGASNEPLRSVQCFDLKTKQWRQLARMKVARRALSAAVLADGIYAIGGFDGNSYMSSVQKYDSASNQWTQTSPMNVARCTHSSIAIYQTQEIYVFGGFDFLPLSSVQKYSLINNEWQKIADMPSPRFMHSSILVKNGFY